MKENIWTPITQQLAFLHSSNMYRSVNRHPIARWVASARRSSPNVSAHRRTLSATRTMTTHIRHKAATTAPSVVNSNLARVGAMQWLPRSRSLATVTQDIKPYKKSPFVQWKLFPDFETLLTQCKPEVAVPAFEQLINSVRDEFLQLEKQFEPTWDGTIGKCKVSCRHVYII